MKQLQRHIPLLHAAVHLKSKNLHESNIKAAIRDYLFEENGSHFLVSSLTLARAVHNILEGYMGFDKIGEVGDEEDYDFIDH
tara:strand:- start:41 stop:286 length:246 start_codon:yes stop_codon:yes gene_type:complete